MNNALCLLHNIASGQHCCLLIQGTPVIYRSGEPPAGGGNPEVPMFWSSTRGYSPIIVHKQYVLCMYEGLPGWIDEFNNFISFPEELQNKYIFFFYLFIFFILKGNISTEKKIFS